MTSAFATLAQYVPRKMSTRVLPALGVLSLFTLLTATASAQVVYVDPVYGPVYYYQPAPVYVVAPQVAAPVAAVPVAPQQAAQQSYYLNPQAADAGASQTVIVREVYHWGKGPIPESIGLKPIPSRAEVKSSARPMIAPDREGKEAKSLPELAPLKKVPTETKEEKLTIPAPEKLLGPKGKPPVPDSRPSFRSDEQLTDPSE